MTKLRGFRDVGSREKGIAVEPEVFDLFIDSLPAGRISEVLPKDAALLSNHYAQQADTFFLAASGLVLDDCGYGVFEDGRAFGLEWIRAPDTYEFSDPNNDTKVNRYVFGVCKADGRIRGYDVTERLSNALTGQVGDHHTTFEELFVKYKLGESEDDE